MCLNIHHAEIANAAFTPWLKHLKLRPTTLNTTSKGDDYIVLMIGAGHINVLNVGGRLRIYAPIDVLPFREGDRVLISVRNDSILIERVDYYVVRPSVKWVITLGLTYLGI